MDVTTDNFSSTLESLRQCIPTCDVIAIDCEFTGLEHESAIPGSTSEEDNCAECETGPEEAQQRCSPLPRVGLCLFQYDVQKRAFVARPYNFYIFPRQFRGQDRRFLCQTRCLHFLAAQNFDFNKLIKSGISFLGHHQERAVREAAPEEEEFVQNTRRLVVNFLADTSQASVVLPPTDAYHRKLTFNELATVFKDVVKADKTMVDNKLCIQVHRTAATSTLGKGAEAVSAAIRRRAAEVEEAQIQQAIGFRHVIDLVASSGKPLVGHNMLLDVVQLEAQFGDHLPDTLRAFRAQVAARFPALFDTKHMIASAPPCLAKHFGAGSRLDSVHKVLCGDAFRHPKVVLDDGCGRYQNKSLHEAGYDAYITGVCFLRIAQFVVMSSDLPLRSNTTGLTPRLRELGSTLPPAATLLEAVRAMGYLNKIFFMGGRHIKVVKLGALPEEGAEEEAEAEEAEAEEVGGEEEGEPIELDAAGPRMADKQKQRWSIEGSSVRHQGAGRGRGKDHSTPTRMNRQRVRDADGQSGSWKKRDEKRPRVST